uniref:Chromo domain-containing protein n=1 Tax=Ananas comosus var. bracteatus TaxID=296719 RepID=A0A6V7Q937_ANACO|nr:unnamed protein product [Ananas comosus var. bracteatus]
MAEFAYNNSYQASIKMALFEALYGRKCRSSLHWSEVGERLALGSYVLREAEDKVRIARERLPSSVSTCSTTEPIGSTQCFHVSVLRKYIFDPTHVLDATPLELRDDLSFEEQPVRILAREVKKLRNRDIPYVKVLWSNHDEREATWELESALQERYPHLFQMES